MSRAALDIIQTQLKAAIQSHQILVSKLRTDPENQQFLQQLKELQASITHLSEQQKALVQLLRKELGASSGGASLVTQNIPIHSSTSSSGATTAVATTMSPTALATNKPVIYTVNATTSSATVLTQVNPHASLAGATILTTPTLSQTPTPAHAGSIIPISMLTNQTPSPAHQPSAPSPQALFNSPRPVYFHIPAGGGAVKSGPVPAHLQLIAQPGTATIIQPPNLAQISPQAKLAQNIVPGSTVLPFPTLKRAPVPQDSILQPPTKKLCLHPALPEVPSRQKQDASSAAAGAVLNLAAPLKVPQYQVSNRNSTQQMIGNIASQKASKQANKPPMLSLVASSPITTTSIQVTTPAAIPSILPAAVIEPMPLVSPKPETIDVSNQKVKTEECKFDVATRGTVPIGECVTVNSTTPAVNGNKPSNGVNNNGSVLGRSTILRTKIGVTLPAKMMRKLSDGDLSDPKHVVQLEQKEASEQERKKAEYMAALHLVSPDVVKDLQCRRAERRRRTTANPLYSFINQDSEKFKKSSYTLAPRKSKAKGKSAKRPHKLSLDQPITTSTHIELNGLMTNNSTNTQDSNEEGGAASPVLDICRICYKPGELLMCDTCGLLYHLQCLDPPLAQVPQGLWSCARCKEDNKSANWPGTLALVHAYVSQKADKEESKKWYQKIIEEQKTSCSILEAKKRQLSVLLQTKTNYHHDLLSVNSDRQKCVNSLNNFIKMFKA